MQIYLLRDFLSRNGMGGTPINLQTKLREQQKFAKQTGLQAAARNIYLSAENAREDNPHTAQTASATRIPSTAADVIPPAYPAPSPHG